MLSSLAANSQKANVGVQLDVVVALRPSVEDGSLSVGRYLPSWPCVTFAYELINIFHGRLPRMQSFSNF